MTGSRLFDAIRDARAAGDEPLVVFDLDGTLYDNSHRTLRILQEFAHTHAQRYPALIARLRTVALKDLAYRVSDSLRAIGFDEAGLADEVTAFWKDRFFTSAYCYYDLPLAGAVELVRAVHDAGGVPTYLTGRDAPNMLQGTIGALQRDGFPIGTVTTRTILKPRFEDDDHAFKRGVIAHLRKVGCVVGAFDNEPGLCNLFKEHFPDATVVHLDTAYAPDNPDLGDGVVRAADFTGLIPVEGAR
ncbi:MAG: haloacid dehalogenase-like hydrolase [Myxococcota bacterium]